VALVQRTGASLGEIAASTRGTSLCTREIAAAMGGLDRTVQSNAGLASETSEACDGLNASLAELQEVTARFRLHNGAGMPEAARVA
jgi:methyl-accepting chemotaxis protein